MEFPDALSLQSGLPPSSLSLSLSPTVPLRLVLFLLIPSDVLALVAITGGPRTFAAMASASADVFNAVLSRSRLLLEPTFCYEICPATLGPRCLECGHGLRRTAPPYHGVLGASGSDFDFRWSSLPSLSPPASGRMHYECWPPSVAVQGLRIF